MRMLLAVLLSPVLLAGCAGIPYEKPEDRAAIQNDLVYCLKINELCKIVYACSLITPLEAKK
ncbi:hypothetical protein C6379_10445 [Pseudomonas syringae pv. actinidiae]|nr:hypothetical protein C6379_10445 [Pseudomonas syringae pv. actinidiae]